MAHQKHPTDVAWQIAQWAGLIGLAALFIPPIRRALGFTAVCLLVFVFMGLVAFSIYRQVRNRARTENPFASSGAPANPETVETAWNGRETLVTLDLLEPAPRRRYPWRHEAG